MTTNFKDNWTLTDLEKHLKVNTDNSYSAAIVMAALYCKLYGSWPKIGLSGAQAQAVEYLLRVMPEPPKDPQLEFPFERALP